MEAKGTCRLLVFDVHETSKKSRLSATCIAALDANSVRCSRSLLVKIGSIVCRI